MPKAINIVVNSGGEFVGIENDNGFELRIGKIEKKGRFFYTRITSEDIENIAEGAQS